MNNINYINYMDKTQLKDLIQECVNEVQNENFIQQLEENLDNDMQGIEESNDAEVLQSLRESLDMDVQALQEAHASNETLMAEGLITEADIDEGFFDTLGQFGKNTFNSVAGAWKKAKAQGDETEAKRLEKRLKDLKSGGSGKGGSTPVSTNTPPVGGGGRRGGGKSAPSKGKSPVSTNTPPVRGGGKPRKKSDQTKIVKKVKSALINKLETDDPKGAAKLKAIASKNPKGLRAALDKPATKKRGKQVLAQIQREKPEGENQGFIAKVGSWMKKNPIKTSVAISLLAVLGTIAAPALAPAIGVGAHAARKVSYDPTIATGTRVSSTAIPDFEE